MNKTTMILGLAAIALLAGCSQGGATSISVGSGIDQSNLCEVKEWRWDTVNKSCKPGQKVIFTPDRFGHESLPVIFAAVNCDMRYTVVQTKGAVACIYNGIQGKSGEETKSAE